MRKTCLPVACQRPRAVRKKVTLYQITFVDSSILNINRVLLFEKGFNANAKDVDLYQPDFVNSPHVKGQSDLRILSK